MTRACVLTCGLIALSLTFASSRLYVVEELVVTVTVPARLRSVSVEPLILVTVPVSPPQKPPPKKDGAPNPALANGAPHPKLNPPRRPKDGLCADGDGLGFAAAVVFAAVGDAARVTMNPAVAPTTAMASPIPNTRMRPNSLRAGSAGGGGGGGSGKSGVIWPKE